jgi:hypothetical protein
MHLGSRAARKCSHALHVPATPSMARPGGECTVLPSPGRAYAVCLWLAVTVRAPPGHDKRHSAKHSLGLTARQRQRAARRPTSQEPAGQPPPLKRPPAPRSHHRQPCICQPVTDVSYPRHPYCCQPEVPLPAAPPPNRIAPREWPDSPATGLPRPGAAAAHPWRGTRCPGAAAREPAAGRHGYCLTPVTPASAASTAACSARRRSAVCSGPAPGCATSQAAVPSAAWPSSATATRTACT